MRPNAPSTTARMVARGLAYVANAPSWSHLVPLEALPLTRTLLITCSLSEGRLLDLMKRPFFRRIIALLETAVTPGILLHYVLRKRYLENLAETAIAEGFRQVVILGAGLDTLALRQHRTFSKVTYIEVDHPATQAVKRTALQRGDLESPGPNLHFLAADLAKRSLPDALVDCPAYDAQADTLFLAEGLLMYLTAEEVGRLFSGVREAGWLARRCRFAFTFLETQASGKPDFPHSSRVLEFWLRLRGEPFRWGMVAGALPAWLTQQGFNVATITTPPELRACYVPETVPPSQVNGDLLCVADVVHPVR